VSLPYGFENLNTGQVEMTGSAQQMPPSLASSIILKALKANAAAIYVGPSGVTDSTGLQINPGDSIVLPVADLNMCYAIGTADDILSYAAMY
jgi:hypothetical protein